MGIREITQISKKVYQSFINLENIFFHPQAKKRLQSPKDCIKSLLIPASCCSGDSSQLPQNQATGKSDQFSLKKLMVFIQLGLAQKVMHIIHILVNHCTRPTQNVFLVSLDAGIGPLTEFILHSNRHSKHFIVQKLF